MIDFLVTTQKDRIPRDRQIVMVDGTVPGWHSREGDLHFDHHRPGGAATQLEEIRLAHESERLESTGDQLFVTTQVDADACVAAAFVILTDLQWSVDDDVYTSLWAIAHDCDHLGLPEGVEFDGNRQFAKDAVATLKITGNKIASELGLPQSRREWPQQDKETYASECFKQGTLWLVEAARGKRDWPGENGEAKEYWDKIYRLNPYVELCSRLYRGAAILDQRSLSSYCDPRLLIEWVRKQEGYSNITLAVRDRPLVVGEISYPAYAYTLGSVPNHPDGSPKFSDRGVWEALAMAEDKKRLQMGFPPASTHWGGRNGVGGSSWNDAATMTPEEVIDCVLAVIS